MDLRKSRAELHSFQNHLVQEQRRSTHVCYFYVLLKEVLAGRRPVTDSGSDLGGLVGEFDAVGKAPGNGGSGGDDLAFVRGLRLRLAPGRYEVFCNMAGHFMGGMHAFINAA